MCWQTSNRITTAKHNERSPNSHKKGYITLCFFNIFALGLCWGLGNNTTHLSVEYKHVGNKNAATITLSWACVGLGFDLR